MSIAKRDDPDHQILKTSLVSKNIIVEKRRTSIRLEPEMWRALQDIARRENCTIHDVCALVNLRKKKNTSLTAAIRVFIVLYFRAATTEEGHDKAGHGNFARMLDRAFPGRAHPSANPQRHWQDRKSQPLMQGGHP